jgi:hypothetical protein
MRAYSNKPQRVDPRRCLYSEIEQGKKATKKAARREGRTQVETEISDELPNC